MFTGCFGQVNNAMRLSTGQADERRDRVGMIARHPV